MNKMSSYDVSIIVPVFNKGKYIKDCIESLLNQTKKGIEIVIVNDGSTDNSLSIIKEYAAKYNNIIYLNKENGGLSSSRIAGLKMAHGKYIGWLDADDFLKPNAIEMLYNLMEKNNADYGYFNVCFYPHKIKNKEVWFKEYKGVTDWNFIERNSQCTNTLTKKSLLDELHMTDLFAKYTEYAYIAVLINAKKIVYSKDEMYVYRVGEESMSGGSYKGKVQKFYNASVITKSLPDMLVGTPYESSLRPYFDYRYIYTLILLEIVSAINNDKKEYKYANDELKRIKYKKNPYTKLILDNNHGKLKSFVLRNVVSLSYPFAKIATRIGMGE